MKQLKLKQLIKEEIVNILREEEDWFVKKYPPKKLTPREKLDLMGGTFLDKINSMRDMDYDQLTALRDHPLFSKHFQSKKYEIGGYISMAKKTGKTYNDQIKDRGLNEEKGEEEVVGAIKGEMNKVLGALKDEFEEKSKTQNEGLLTVAGVALALPAIMGLIAKFGKAAGNIVRKILGKKPTNKGEYQEWMIKLGGIADDLHHLYMIPIKKIVSKFIKDKSKADKVANIIFHIIIATFLIISGATAVKALQAKNLQLSTLEAALTAVKGGEVKAFISKIAG